MKNESIGMPEVSRCDVSKCSYNVGSNCHAIAITVGDGSHPGCDTFLDSNKHVKETKRIAGVGACKVISCQHNEDLECSAEKIIVGVTKNDINCRTFVKRDIQF